VKVAIVLPAYNAELTLERTFDDIPADYRANVILVDDASRDRTVEISRRLGIHTVAHPKNRGYGGNQKTCYATALAQGADIVVMVHPDHQYDPKMIPRMVAPLAANECDAVWGSRMLGGRPLEGGMPRWKFIANVALTALANVVFMKYFTEIHSGFRAYSRRYLETVNLAANSDDFVFDTEIIAQGVACGMRVHEIPIETRYFEEASQISFRRSVVYGLQILWTLARYSLHQWGILTSSQYEPRVAPTASPSAGQ